MPKKILCAVSQDDCWRVVIVEEDVQKKMVHIKTQEWVHHAGLMVIE